MVIVGGGEMYGNNQSQSIVSLPLAVNNRPRFGKYSFSEWTDSWQHHGVRDLEYFVFDWRHLFSNCWTMNSNSNTPETCDSEFQKFLQEKSEGNDITAMVADRAIFTEQPAVFFDQLARYGCVSWMVSTLIYYADTHAFFDQHYYEIQELKDEWEDSVWHPLKISGDIKNFLAWFAFEEVAYKTANKRGVF